MKMFHVTICFTDLTNFTVTRDSQLQWCKENQRIWMALRGAGFQSHVKPCSHCSDTDVVKNGCDDGPYSTIFPCVSQAIQWVLAGKRSFHTSTFPWWSSCTWFHFTGDKNSSSSMWKFASCRYSNESSWTWNYWGCLGWNSGMLGVENLHPCHCSKGDIVPSLFYRLHGYKALWETAVISKYMNNQEMHHHR